MKKSILILALVFVALTSSIQAQTLTVLTNNTIVKMVKASLSDEIIIDEINNANVNFNLSPDSVSYLANEKVSEQVIQVMKVVNEKQNPVAEITAQEEPVDYNSTQTTEPTQEIQTETQITTNQVATSETTEPLVSENKIQQANESTTNSIEAVSYTIPIEGLINYFNNEYNNMTNLIKGYDSRIRDSINRINKIKLTLTQYEKDLTNTKNADTKAFTNDILIIKKSVVSYREKYKQAKGKMFTDGMNIVKEIKEKSEAKNSEIGSKFSETCKNIKDYKSDPSKGREAKTISITKQKFNEEIINYVTSLKEIPCFYQNEIIVLQNLITQYSIKAEEIIKKDAELAKQLEPLDKQMNDLKQDSKKNKKEISELKKQCSKIEKERKQLEEQMGSDSKQLSESLKQSSKEIQSTLIARYIDIIETINFSYLDKFNLD